MKALIIGKGNVGRAMSEILALVGWQSCFFTGRAPDDRFVEAARDADIVFLAISTKDKGEIEFGYIMKCLELGKPIVTCAKGALAWHFDELKPHLDKIGFSTTVGGASSMLALARSPHLGTFEEAAGSLNGTMNFLCWSAEHRLDPYTALAEARREALCEPGARTLTEVVNGEVQDVIKKASILFNVLDLDLGYAVSPDDFSYRVFTDEELVRLFSSPTCRRFIVTIAPSGRYPLGSSMLYADAKPWDIIGSFADAPAEFFNDMPVNRQNNCLSLQKKGIGREMIWGIGAGAQPTAAAMFGDARKLLCV